MESHLMTIPEFAKATTLSPWTIRKLLAEKKLAYIKLGRRVAIESGELHKFIEKGRVQAA